MTVWKMALCALEALDMGRPLDAKGYLRNILAGAEQSRWEYFVWLPPDPDRFGEDLAELGWEGWELILQLDVRFIFKRRSQEEL